MRKKIFNAALVSIGLMLLFACSQKRTLQIQPDNDLKSFSFVQSSSRKEIKAEKFQYQGKDVSAAVLKSEGNSIAATLTLELSFDETGNNKEVICVATIISSASSSIIISESYKYTLEKGVLNILGPFEIDKQ
ncbi:MAG: hypothetical protein LBU22_12790 [Dysgonamonadaceae bacterium]|jgi:hypothetical protein|nr:hypothetical protein [Dysgonamonadaceae bacterium]